MSPAQPSLHSAWAQLFVCSLAKAGVRSVVVSPGSRSTPLAIAFAQHPDLTISVIVDERVAGFFALGQARAVGVPTVLLCTSGTAGAHYLPALIEASQSHIPLLVITADRPWEDYDCAAAQTIDQVKLFGDVVRHYAELGLPDAHPAALSAVVRIAAQAVATSCGPLPGPVHINARFRKPLEPSTESTPQPFTAHIDALLARPAATVISGDVGVSAAAIDALYARCHRARRGLIVCGPAASQTDLGALRIAVQRLSQQTGFPVWAESTSGVRFGVQSEICGGFDVALRSPDFRREAAPELLIEVGGPVVSSAYAQLVSALPSCERVVVAPYGWNDPHGSAALLLRCVPELLLSAVADRLALHAAERPSDPRWTLLHHQAEEAIRRIVSAAIQTEHFTEGQLARAVVTSLPAHAALLVGNSLPVRDLDLFCVPSDKPLRVFHQRGASGIDGLLSGAAGARSVLADPVALLLGDVSALHDLSGLQALQAVSGPLVVVIVQNGGGQIFAQLPIGSNALAKPYFSSLFLTPRAVDFGQAAAAFGIPFLRVCSEASLRTAMAQALAADRPFVIEAVVSGDEGACLRKQIQQQALQVFAQTSKSLSAQQSIPQVMTDSKPTEPLITLQPQVFLHGFLGSPALWEPIIRRCAAPTFCPYLPGHGPSPWLLADADFDAVIDALAARIPFPRFALHGYSLGARVALALAIRHPDRVQSLTLIGADPGIRDDKVRAERTRWESALCQKLLHSDLSDFVKEWESLPLFSSQQRLPDHAKDAQRSQRLDQDRTALAWALRVLGTGQMPSQWSQIPSLRIPMLVLTGALDDKFTALGRALSVLHPQVTHRIAPGCGHNLLLEDPSWVWSQLVAQHGAAIFPDIVQPESAQTDQSVHAGTDHPCHGVERP
ncbi:MAG: 2-succinyl-5-enolpyruvyl-6-hydroxy-3-cyclohexene-1-carboxylic-acid synthase [Myxococcales bacterium]|nr:2-succinyl-5-enolpyruvyl-6-hydroxy-3-cyclohexene-1-carboxylic-acid synthase [Myxococcales bacterium]